MSLGISAEIALAVLVEIDVGTGHDGTRGDGGGHVALYREIIEPKNNIRYHLGDHTIREAAKRQQVPNGADTLFYDAYLTLYFWDMLVCRCGIQVNVHCI